ncbi:hypothetical protein BC628DRAFT_1387529 [Trametes gibbosa]|nr:hypothetical protein BC628DRAFT_1387529 [Trametes gibbosa]
MGRGRWAGASIDIVLLQNLSVDDEGPWKDVMEETGRIVRGIWEAEYEDQSY